MKHLSMLVLLTPLTLLLAAATPRADDPAWFAPLGQLGGLNSLTQPTAISADGSTVVGWHAAGDPQQRQAFRWTAATGLVGLGDLPGGAFDSAAADVSADGTTVVGTGTAVHGSRVFRWTPGNGMAEVFDATSSASGVSADGSVIVGGIEGARTRQSQAFRWEAGALSLLTNSHSANEWAQGVSADGSVVLTRWSSCDEVTCSGGTMFWDALGATVDLPITDGYAISADGSTVVGADVIWAYGMLASVWTLRTGELQLGCGAAVATSADGTVVVGPYSCPDWEPFIWTQSGGLHVLQPHLETVYGLDLTGWTIDSVVDISADGRTLVGSGLNPEGDREGWLAHLGTPIPQPFTDIGPGVGGGFGDLQLKGDGDLSPGSSAGFTVALTGALPLTGGLLFVSLEQGAIPFKGGTFYPTPVMLGVPIAVDIAGLLNLGSSIPRGTPSGTSFVLQAWVHDITAPFYYAGSNGLRLLVP
jgi:probable HAF family extracellular repeat protein